jgi:Sulfatase
VKGRRFLEGSGIAVVLMFQYASGIISPYHLSIYHHLLPSTTVVYAVLIDVIVFALLGAAIFALLDHLPSAYKNLGLALLLSFLAWRTIKIASLVKSTFTLTSDGGQSAAMWETHLGLLAPILLCLLLVLRFISKKYLALCLELGRSACLVIGCSIFWIVPELLYGGMQPQSHETPGFQRAIAGSPEHSRRIVWILLDELSYDQTFEHRQSGIELPNLDELRQHGAMFSHLEPAGYHTNLIIPSLLTGHVYNDIRGTYQGNLFLSSDKGKHWVAFDEQTTLFADAKRLGWSTGVTGWFNPYCRILRDVVDTCYWQNKFDFPLDSESSILANAWGPVLKMVQVLPHFGEVGGRNLAEWHREDYEKLLSSSISMLQNDSARFLLLHLPVPHPPGIYDRETHKFRNGGDYLDNLVLTDEVIGRLRSLIEQSPSAQQTILIVSSDHSWRVPMYQNREGWTKEEQAATQGRFDSRPVLLVHFPGQTERTEVDKPIPQIAMHDMIGKMLEGELQSEKDLEEWIAEHHT